MASSYYVSGHGPSRFELKARGATVAVVGHRPPPTAVAVVGRRPPPTAVAIVGRRPPPDPATAVAVVGRRPPPGPPTQAGMLRSGYGQNRSAESSSASAAAARLMPLVQQHQQLQVRARLGSLGEARLGEARLGSLGEARLGEARLGSLGEARLASLGEARLASLGEARLGSLGEARLGSLVVPIEDVTATREIIANMRQAEKRKLPFKAAAPQLGRRSQLVQWAAFVAQSLGLADITVHLAVKILDQFMDGHDIQEKQLYLVVLCCLLVAAKFEEANENIPKITDLNRFVNNFFPWKDFVNLELLIMKYMDWNVFIPTTAHFIQMLLSYAIHPLEVRKARPQFEFKNVKNQFSQFVRYFMDKTLQSEFFIVQRPSHISAAVLSCARQALELKPFWPRPLRHASGIAEPEAFRACADKLSAAFREETNCRSPDPPRKRRMTTDVSPEGVPLLHIGPCGLLSPSSSPAAAASAASPLCHSTPSYVAGGGCDDTPSCDANNGQNVSVDEGYLSSRSLSYGGGGCGGGGGGGGGGSSSPRASSSKRQLRDIIEDVEAPADDDAASCAAAAAATDARAAEEYRTNTRYLRSFKTAATKCGKTVPTAKEKILNPKEKAAAAREKVAAAKEKIAAAKSAKTIAQVSVVSVEASLHCFETHL